MLAATCLFPCQREPVSLAPPAAPVAQPHQPGEMHAFQWELMGDEVVSMAPGHLETPNVGPLHGNGRACCQ